MKNLLVAFMLLPVLASASETSTVVAERTVSVFFAPSAHRGVHKLVVTQDGKVSSVFVKAIPGAKPESRVIAKISPNAVNTIVKLGKLIKSDEPELTKVAGPGCMDAPSTFFRVKNENGKLAVIQSKINCKDQTLVDENLYYEVRPVIDALQGLDAIEDLDAAKN